MKQVNYIIVHETVGKNAGCDVTYRDVPHVGHCCFVSAPDIDTLVRLRNHWPEAPILGDRELDTSSSHAPVRVSPAMNRLRRKMSDLP